MSARCIETIHFRQAKCRRKDSLTYAYVNAATPLQSARVVQVNISYPFSPYYIDNPGKAHGGCTLLTGVWNRSFGGLGVVVQK